MQIISQKQPRPPRIFLYGPAGIGKTTLGVNFPGALFLPVEEGADVHDVPRLPKPETWEQAMGFIEELTADPSGFRALVIDSVTALEALAMKKIMIDERVKSVEEIPYGKGFPLVAALWVDFLNKLDALRARGMAIIMIGHQAIVRFEDPRSTPYDRYQPRLHKSILPMTIERCDILAFANYKVFTESKTSGFNKERSRAIGNGDRALFLTEMPTHLAKNRFSLPDEVEMSWAEIFKGIAAAFKTNIQTPPASTDAQQGEQK
jgi:hypothetical protein